MSDNVIDLGGRAAKVGGTPNPIVIKQITDLLALATSGELQQVAFVYADRTGTIVDGYAPGGTPQELICIIGGLELCKATLLAEMIETGSPHD